MLSNILLHLPYFTVTTELVWPICFNGIAPYQRNCFHRLQKAGSLANLLHSN